MRTVIVVLLLALLTACANAPPRNPLAEWVPSPNFEARRPLIIVYDEAHNLSDQQTDLLLELEPDIILAASATMRTPGKLGQIIDRLKQVGWNAEAIS